MSMAECAPMRIVYTKASGNHGIGIRRIDRHGQDTTHSARIARVRKGEHCEQGARTSTPRVRHAGE